MILPLKMALQDIKEYNLVPKTRNSMVLNYLFKGMYRLPQAELILYGKLVQHLVTSGYIAARLNPSLFKQETISITFYSIYHDFSIWFTYQQNAQYLINQLKKSSNQQ